MMITVIRNDDGSVSFCREIDGVVVETGWAARFRGKFILSGPFPDEEFENYRDLKARVTELCGCPFVGKKPQHQRRSE